MTLAFADVTSVSPAQIFVGTSEEFLTISGTGLSGTVTGEEGPIYSSTVVFSGPAGTIAVPASVASSDGTTVIVFVPGEVASTAGGYVLDVYANFDTGPVLAGTGFFNVVEQVIESPPLLFIPEILVAEAETVEGATVTFDIIATSADGATTYPVTCTPQSGSLFALGS